MREPPYLVIMDCAPLATGNRMPIMVDCACGHWDMIWTRLDRIEQAEQDWSQRDCLACSQQRREAGR